MPAERQAANEAALRAGAARIDYTPAADKLPRNYLGVLDPIYIRCIVIDNGRTRAALVSIDAGGDVHRPVQQGQRARGEGTEHSGGAAADLGHAHAQRAVPGRWRSRGEGDAGALPRRSAKLQPARVAWGTGVSYINVNRDIVDPATNRWWEGPNYEGTSDKTVAVMRFEIAAGRADRGVQQLRGARRCSPARWIWSAATFPAPPRATWSEHLGGDVVALWTSGAAGDQNPIYFDQTYELRDIRIKDYAKRGEDISNSMPPGGHGPGSQQSARAGADGASRSR